MTYPLLVLPFLLITAIVTLATVRHPHFGRRMLVSALSAVILFALTAVFDNVMIAAGLFTYPEEHLIGVRVGLAPLEDFAYPLSAAYLLPAVATLLARKPDPKPETAS